MLLKSKQYQRRNIADHVAIIEPTDVHGKQNIQARNRPLYKINLSKIPERLGITLGITLEQFVGNNDPKKFFNEINLIRRGKGLVDNCIG